MLFSGSSDYPYCRTHLYEDDVFTGYTLLGCAVAAGTDSVVYSPTLSMNGLSSTSTLDSSSTSSYSLGASRSSTTSSPTTSSSSMPTTPPPPKSTNSSAPIGAIVGGVVGGVAVIALFALGLVLLLRRRRQQHHDQGPGHDPYAPIHSPGANQPQHPQSQPAMQQHFQQPHLQPAPVMGNRSSIAKPSPVSTAQPIYDPAAAGSPSPQNQSLGTIPPAYQATSTNASPAAAAQSISPTIPDTPQQQRPESYAQPGYQEQVQPVYHHQEGHYFEMPTVRSDRELRELA